MPQPVQYITAEQPGVQYVTGQPTTVTYAAPQTTVTYEAPQAVQYVTTAGAGQPIYMEQPAVQYVTAEGQPIAQPIPTTVSAAPPVQYVTADGQPIQYEALAAPAPTVYNISPEQFARLAQGGSMTTGEIDGLMGVTGAAPVEAAGPQTASFVALPGALPTAA